MDAEAHRLLAGLFTHARTGALGTLRGGGPNVSMVACLPEPDWSAFWLRLSRLAWHTQDLARDARATLMLCETDDRRADPQTLARLTIRGDAAALALEDPRCEPLRHAWVERFPASEVTFELADFSFWRLAPRDARFVAGLARTYTLTAPDLVRAAPGAG